MCSEPLYALRLKTEYDEKFKRFQKRSKLIFVGSVRKYADGSYVNNRPVYDCSKYDLLVIPCGQCWHCRLVKSKTKAFQCVCESQSHKKNCFVTLTFDFNKLYNYFRKEKGFSYYMAKKFAHYHCWSLENDLVTKFIKKLRHFYYNRELGLFLLSKGSEFQQYVYDDKGNFKSHIRCPKKYKAEFMPKIKIRYYRVGEYGTQKGRPHHHICFFGINLAEFGTLSDWYSNGKHMYTSSVLDKLWKFGISTVDIFNYNTAAYVARYCTKKVYGKFSEEMYEGRKPEFACSSNRNGLGYDYAVKNYKELLNNGKVTIIANNKKLVSKIPRYFLEVARKLDFDFYNNYTEKCIENNNIEIEKLLDKERSIYTDLDSKNKKSLCILNKLSRDFENENMSYESFIERLGAHSISLDVAEMIGTAIFDKLNLKYKDFERKSSNYVLRKKYQEFENNRKKMINKIYNVKNIERTDEELKNEIDFIKSIKNPFKCRKRGYQLLSDVEQFSF